MDTFFVPIKSDLGIATYRVEIRRSTGKAIGCTCPARLRCKHAERGELTPAFITARGQFEATGMSREDFNAKFATTVTDFKASRPKKDHRLAVNHAIKRVIEGAAGLPRPQSASEPCHRCGGEGWFLPIYRHIQRGICFRCRGARVEPTRH